MPLGLISDLVGGYANYRSNRAMQNRQNAWQEKFWHMQNEYNLPVNQKKRLDEAGINGALSLAGASTNAGISSMPTAAGASGGNPLSFDAFKNLLLQQQQFDLHQEKYYEEIDSLRKQNKEKDIELLFKADQILADLGIKKEQKRGMVLQNMFQQQTMEDRIQQVQQQTEQSIIQTSTMYLQREMMNTQFKYMDKRQQAEIQQIYAQIASATAAAALASAQTTTEGYKRKLINAQILDYGAKRWKTAAEANGIILSNQKARAMMNYEIERARLDSLPKNSYERMEKFSSDNYNYLDYGLDWIGTHVLGNVGNIFR